MLTYIILLSLPIINNIYYYFINQDYISSLQYQYIYELQYVLTNHIYTIVKYKNL